MWVGGLYGTDLRSRILAVFPAAVLFLSRWRARARWRERKSAEVFSLEHLAPPPLCVHPRGRARRRRGPTCGRTCGRAYTKHAHTLANRLHTFARRASARAEPHPTPSLQRKHLTRGRDVPGREYSQTFGAPASFQAVARPHIGRGARYVRAQGRTLGAGWGVCRRRRAHTAPAGEGVPYVCPPLRGSGGHT